MNRKWRNVKVPKCHGGWVPSLRRRSEEVIEGNEHECWKQK